MGLDYSQLFSIEDTPAEERNEAPEISPAPALFGTDHARRASEIQTEILKGLKTGTDIYRLFLKAAEAISIMTGDTLFIKQIRADIKSIYGRGLQEPPALALELDETEQRLQKLKAAEARETEPENLQRIKTAIKAHEAQIEALKQKL